MSENPMACVEGCFFVDDESITGVVFIRSCASIKHRASLQDAPILKSTDLINSKVLKSAGLYQQSAAPSNSKITRRIQTTAVFIGNLFFNDWRSFPVGGFNPIGCFDQKG